MKDSKLKPIQKIIKSQFEFAEKMTVESYQNLINRVTTICASFGIRVLVSLCGFTGTFSQLNRVFEVQFQCKHDSLLYCKEAKPIGSECPFFLAYVHTGSYFRLQKYNLLHSHDLDSQLILDERKKLIKKIAEHG